MTSAKVGDFRVERATHQQILKRFGRSRLNDRNAANYDCTRKGCRTNFFFGRHGRFANRLVGAVLESPSRGYQTKNGTTIGMTADEARQREPQAMVTTTCGTPALRYPGARGVAGAFSGLNILLLHGRVASFVVMSPHERVSCLGGGAFSPAT